LVVEEVVVHLVVLTIQVVEEVEQVGSELVLDTQSRQTLLTQLQLVLVVQLDQELQDLMVVCQL